METHLPNDTEHNNNASYCWKKDRTWPRVAYLLTFFSLISVFAFGQQCSANFSFNADSGNPMHIFFQDASQPSSGANITSWAWDFGDGNTSSVTSPDHTYANEGTYNVVLNITDDQSCNNSYTATVEVGNAGPACEARFDFVASFLDVSFSNQSTGDNLTYSWDFGDGNSSTDLSPTHSYSQAGVYTVKLTVINASTGCEDLKDISVNVTGTECAANFDGTDDPQNPLTVMVFDKSSVATGNVTSWSWDFGDGSAVNTNQNPTHTYANAGTYNICLTIETDGGCSNQHCLNDVQIGGGNNCYANFNFYQPDQANNYLLVNFDNVSDVSGGYTSATWDFGDGNTSTDLNATAHTYAQEGDYNVTLIVGNDNGCSDTIAHMVGVHPANNCFGEFGWSQDNNTNHLEVSFHNYSDIAGGITSTSWDFGDGNTSTDITPMHTYAQDGDYQVVMIVNGDASCSDTVVHMVSIQPSCHAEFGWQQNDPNNHLEVSYYNYSNISGGITSISWNFGDGNTSTEENPVHVYAQDGDYNVTMIANGSAGCIDTIMYNIGVYPQNQCEANFGFHQPDESNFLKVQFDNYSNVSGGIQTAEWAFGDGNGSTDMYPMHEYVQEGEYQVTLTVTGQNGCSNTITNTVHVFPMNNGGNNCGEAHYIYSVDASNGRIISFTRDSEAPPAGSTITDIEWHFGDGNMSNEDNPTHTYAQDGAYEVHLKEVIDSGACFREWNLMININSSGCVANFGGYMDSTTQNLIHFQNFSIVSAGNTATYTWNFDDGTTSTEFEPSHQFAEGNYNVCVTVNSTSGCSNTFCQPVDLGNHNCEPNFFFDKDPNDPFKVYFHDQSNAMQPIISRSWDFGDGSTSTDLNPNHIYSQEGDYSVCLEIVTEDSCVNNFCMMIHVGEMNNQPPPPGGCMANFFFEHDTANFNKIHFFDQSNAGAPINAYSWTFGDNSSATGAIVSHEYNGPGEYDVCLTITDTSGCSATHCMTVFIDPDGSTGPGCHASFTYNHDTVPGGVQFYASGSANITGGYWDFGDGTTASEQAPYHTFPGPGYYDVCITVWDSISGCQNHFCDGVYIAPQDSNDVVTNNCNAEFDFTVNENTVSFFDVSQGNVHEWYWEFGNGSVSHEQSPVYTYSGPGFYEVCLGIKDTVSGCHDFFCKPIEIMDTMNTVNCFANFSYVPSANNPYGISFSNLSDGSYTHAHWSFGDGGHSDAMNPNHVYNGPGYYDVCLDVMDSVSGCMAHFCKPVQVGDPNNDSTFADCFAEFDFFMEPDGSVGFVNNSSMNATDFHWEFGDMTFSDMENPSHMYANAGSYQVCLMIKDSVSGCVADFCMMVHAAATTDSTFVSCEAKFNYFQNGNNSIQFDNTSLGSFTNVHWEFANLGYSDNYDATFTFPQPGIYDVCLGVMDSVSGCMDYVCKPVQVYPDANDSTVYDDCNASFNFFTEADGSVAFMNESSGDYDVLHWSFGDGTHSTMENPSHMYANGGVYTACVKVYNTDNGCMDQYCDEIVIVDENDSTFVICEAGFNAFPQGGYLVDFENTSVGNFTEVYWNFSDGTTSYEMNPEHQFASPGIKGACLTVFDPTTGCQDMFCKEFVLSPDTSSQDVYCEAHFDYFVSSGSEVVFENNSFGSFTDVYWNFSNGVSAYDFDAINDYGSEGIHGACLTVLDSVSGCQATFCDEIEIISDSTVFCSAEFGYYVDMNTVYFEPFALGSYTDIFWDFGDGFNSNDAYPSHDFENGFYEVCLTVYDTISGCMDTYCANVNINASSATDEFCLAEFSYFVQQNTTTVNFTDLSLGGADTWYWSFGDNAPASMDQNPTYTYSEDGYYEVCLTVGTANGCQETYCAVIAVGDVSNSCYAKFDYYANSVTSTAHFENNSLGNVDGYTWAFGDGDESFQYQPSHTYADTGYYAACLTVSSSVTGCEDIYCNDIRVGNALANPCLFSCVWPGDANNDLEANHYDLLTVGLNYGETGPMRDSVSIEWLGHFGQDWSTFQWDGVNNKHGDCNGDGIIDEQDMMAIETNFAYSHPEQPRSNAGELLSFEIINPNVTVGEDIEIAVLVGESTPVDLYGLGFEFNIDPNLFDYNTLTVDFSNSWLGEDGTDMITFDRAEENLGQVFMALSRRDQANQSGSGEIVRFRMTAIGIDEAGTDISLTTNGGMDVDGDSIPFTADQTEDIIINSVENIDFQAKELLVYPNPTNSNISFNLPVLSTNYQIEIFDNLGNIVYANNAENGGNIDLELSMLASGLYTIQVNGDNLMYTQRFNVVK